MKPSDFFVGAMEFFAVLMPGALLAFLLFPLTPVVFGPVLAPLKSGLMEWVAFTVVAFVLGHLLHHVGSYLDHFYDQGYRAEKRGLGDEPLYTRTRKLMQAELETTQAELDRMNVFGWAGSYVRAHNAGAAVELERAGGESKFFRSLCIVAGLAAVLFLLRYLPLAALGAGAVAVFSYRRFCKRRWDVTQLTYEYYVLLKHQAQASGAPPAHERNPGRFGISRCCGGCAPARLSSTASRLRRRSADRWPAC